MTPAARPYAEALFSLLHAKGETEQVLAEIDAVVAALGEVPHARDLLVHPGAAPAAAEALLSDLAAGRSPVVGNLLRLLFQKGRMRVLPDIAQGVRERLDAAEGRLRARVQTARPMAAAQAQALSRALGRRFGSQVQLSFEQRADLIGGVRVLFADRVMDGSLEGYLQSLRRRLTAGAV